MPNYHHESSRHTRTEGRRRKLAAFVSALGIVLVVMSCRTGNRSVVRLPNVPGAEYIGSKECEACHAQIARDFVTADHARLIAAGTNSIHAGCESCHGPASLHAQSGGDVKTPYGSASGRPQSGSFGARQGLAHARETESLCFQCHTDVRSQFSLPSHHPVAEGKLTCTDCHPPHKGSIHTGGGTSILSENESCLRCHAAQRGPFVFEHEAVREGCISCHKPHGSVNDKLLAVRDANACLKCHFQSTSGGRLLIGGSDHTLRAQQGTCWTAGCHEAVHGSRVSPSLRF